MSSLVFPCGGGGCTLVIRNDLPELENAAKKFELDKELVEELQQPMGNEDLLSLSTIFPVEEDDYFPFCDINLEVGNLSETPLSFAASTLCSFRDNDFTHASNVRFSTV